MHLTVRDLADHFRAVLTRGPDVDYWTEVWKAIEALPLYATGDNYCFEIRRFDELADPSQELFALPVAAFEDRWDSIAFAQSALEGMAVDGTVAEFSATLMAARIEIVKSRMFCVAHHVYWASDQPGAQYGRRVQEWLESISGQRLSYADEEFYRLVSEPSGAINRGSARWLSLWLQFRYDDRNCPVHIRPRLDQEEPLTEAQTVAVNRSIVLAAAAFTWHDYALVQDITATRAAQLGAAAGLALFLAMQCADDDNEHGDDSSSWGRKGGLERHRHTRALKDWALAEADRMQGADRHIARELANRLPQKYLGVSEDPVRLIYDAIRAKRAQEQGRQGK